MKLSIHIWKYGIKAIPTKVTPKVISLVITVVINVVVAHHYSIKLIKKKMVKEKVVLNLLGGNNKNN